MSKLKKLFLTELTRATAGWDSIAVALSSGVDSTAVMLGLLELGKEVTAYTFHVDGIDSQDFKHAKKNAKEFGVEFVEVILPRKAELKKIVELIKDYGLRKKTDIECAYPFMFLLPEVIQDILITGSCADGHFCLSKKGMINYRGTIEKMKEFRTALFSNPNYAQVQTLGTYALDNFEIIVDNPFNKEAIVEYFMPLSWDAVNKPKQKQPILDMFPKEFSRIKRFNHTNLQCGDSGLRETFEYLLNNKQINQMGRKRMLDVYRDMSVLFGEKK